MNQEQLNAIKQRAENATPGPWLVAPEKCSPEGQGVYESDGFGCICEVGDPYPRGNNRPQENMVFIANAREDVPALVAEVERLREVLKGAAVVSNQAKGLVEENKRLRQALTEILDFKTFDLAKFESQEIEIARQDLAGGSNEK